MMLIQEAYSCCHRAHIGSSSGCNARFANVSNSGTLSEIPRSGRTSCPLKKKELKMRLIVGILSFIIFSFLSTVIFKIIDPVSFRYIGDLPFFLIFLSYSVLVLSPVIITIFYIRKKYLVYYSLVMAMFY